MTKAIRILLIDDHDTFRKMARLMLVSAGYEVQEAASGKTALAAYRQQPSDLVITDILMPDMEGLELIQALRVADPDVKIVAMSGGGVGRADQYLEHAARFGARRTLVKPFTLAELLAAVTDALTS